MKQRERSPVVQLDRKAIDVQNLAGAQIPNPGKEKGMISLNHDLIYLKPV